MTSSYSLFTTLDHHFPKFPWKPPSIEKQSTCGHYSAQREIYLRGRESVIPVINGTKNRICKEGFSEYPKVEFYVQYKSQEVLVVHDYVIAAAVLALLSVTCGVTFK